MLNNKDKMFLGVCSAIANVFGVPVSLVRLAAIVLMIASGSIVFWLYLLTGIFLMMNED